jgi:ABC-type Fe3+-hydroxamate transport system substrate-binding protein
MKIKIYFSIMLFSFLFWSACTSKSKEKAGSELAEEIIEQATGSKVELENGGANVTIEGNGEKVEINQKTNKWPDEVSNDFPKVDGATITRVVRSETNEQLTFNIYYNPLSEDQIAKYEADLKKNGFNVQKIDFGGKGQLSGEKDKSVVMFIFGDKISMLSIQQAK